MRGRIISRCLPKGGSRREEFEDALFATPGIHDHWFYCHRLQAVIADGASESMLAGPWARRLVETFGRAKLGRVTQEDFSRTLETALDGWSEVVASYRDHRAARGMPLQWYDDAKLARGAHATLLVTVLTPKMLDPERGNWVALAVGDACVVQVRRDRVQAAFPIITSDAFGISPALVHSMPASSELATSQLQRHTGTWRRGDSFYLLTDALAAWFLAAVETGHRPWRILRQFDSAWAPDAFARWAGPLRANGDLRNDDLTLLRIDLH